MTFNEWNELLEVLVDAVDNTSALYVEAMAIYNDNYRPHRLAALKAEWELAVKVKNRVERVVKELNERWCVREE